SVVLPAPGKPMMRIFFAASIIAIMPHTMRRNDPGLVPGLLRDLVARMHSFWRARPAQLSLDTPLKQPAERLRPVVRVVRCSALRAGDFVPLRRSFSPRPDSRNRAKPAWSGRSDL